MERILTLQDKNFDSHASDVDRSNFTKRLAARAVVLDNDNKVGLMYVSKEGYYKLPGGGIDEGEDISAALTRELLEELGCQAKIIQPLGEVLEYRDYWQLIQTSYSYLARLSGDKGSPNLTELERSQGFEVTWQNNITAALTALQEQQPTGSEKLAYQFMQARDIAILEMAQKAIGASKGAPA